MHESRVCREPCIGGAQLALAMQGRPGSLLGDEHCNICTRRVSRKRSSARKGKRSAASNRPRKRRRKPSNRNRTDAETKKPASGRTRALLLRCLPNNGQCYRRVEPASNASRSFGQASPDYEVEMQDRSHGSQDQPGRLGYAIRVREGNLPWELYYGTFVRHVQLEQPLRLHKYFAGPIEGDRVIDGRS